MRDELSGSFALTGRADGKVATKDKKKLRGRVSEMENLILPM
jgi:hypothetical protein